MSELSTARTAPAAVGIDGGGTSTRVLLVDADGATLGLGKSGSGNLHDVGEARLRAHIDDAWRRAWAQVNGGAGSEPERLGAAFCAMASVGTPGNRETIQRVVAEVGVAALDDVEVDVDLAGALAGGLGGTPGIAIIAGTGSSCFGRDAAGSTFQSGGWGSLLDDVGGATWIGTQAMVAAVRAFDGRGPSTTLFDAVLAHFSLSHMRELLPKVDADGTTRAARAQLAKLVTEAHLGGDEVSRDILVRGADALAECAEAVAGKLAFSPDSPLEVVATGGLAENFEPYRALIHQSVEERIPRATCVLPRHTNVEGAAMLALARLQTGRSGAGIGAGKRASG
ncbi:MAG: BadF/BadG/BcrA/BcrD ATPase family protein [Planctomycetota bacterium]